MVKINWSEERIKKMLQENDFSYQNIELPYGLSTGGHDRSSTAKKIFPDDMTGKSVLDVGAKFGYFCFEALKRGAARVVGIDVDPGTVRKARMLADCLGVKVAFELLDIETDPIRETFDYVLCLNLLHHLKHPIAALDKLTAMTRERLILEVTPLGRSDRKKVGASFFQWFFLKRFPAIFVSASRGFGKKSSQKFFITSSALEHFLLYHRTLFARVETFPSDHKNRYISIAHKRRIGKLIVVAGSTAVGKSTLVDKLRKNKAPEVAKKVGIDDGSTWTVTSAHTLMTLTEPCVEKLIFHYDLLRPSLRNAKVPQRDEALGILDAADQITFLTLWCPPEGLREQKRHSDITPKTNYNGYQEFAKVREHYQNWFEYTRTRGTTLSSPLRTGCGSTL